MTSIRNACETFCRFPDARSMMIFVDELTDLLRADDPATGSRLPVRRAAVIAQLEAGGQRRAARLARRLPAVGGVLVPGEIDALQVRVHCELQRLGEELQLPRRIAEWLVRFRAARPGEPIRVVDVGCGLGHVIRWLAAHDALGAGAELVGVDRNTALVDRATDLAAAERLACRFVAGDALAPGVAGDAGVTTVVISSGLLHHLSVAELPGFFAAQRALDVAAFAHWDIDPGPWTTLGAWIFHQARMREPVSRHDGVLSARRAHPAPVLLAAARAGAPDYDPACTDGRRWHPRLSEVLRPITGAAPRGPAGVVR
jgi:SAM-dependent methyltransferase